MKYAASGLCISRVSAGSGAPFEHAEVAEQVPDAALGDPDRGGARGAAAAELGEQERPAQLLDRGIEHAGHIELLDHQADRGPERQHRRLGPRHLRRIGLHVHAAERHEGERPAAGVQVDHGIACTGGCGE